RQGLVPLLRDLIEVVLHFLDRARLKLEEALASLAHVADDTCILEHSQMLGDRLPRNLRTSCELRNRPAPPVTKLADERKPRFVPERGKYGRVRLACAAATRRHDARCSSSAGPSRSRSCGRLPGASRPAACRSSIPSASAECRSRSARA